jgi:hypothetical protein
LFTGATVDADGKGTWVDEVEGSASQEEGRVELRALQRYRISHL